MGYTKHHCRHVRYKALCGFNREECVWARRLAVAVMLGALIGWERRQADRPAGIRTMSMVSLGSCLFTVNSTFAFIDGPMTVRLLTALTVIRVKQRLSFLLLLLMIYIKVGLFSSFGCHSKWCWIPRRRVNIQERGKKRSWRSQSCRSWVNNCSFVMDLGSCWRCLWWWSLLSC